MIASGLSLTLSPDGPTFELCLVQNRQLSEVLGQQIIYRDPILRVVALHLLRDSLDRCIEFRVGVRERKFLFQEISRMRFTSSLSLNDTSEESRFCNAIPQYRTMPAIAFASGLLQVRR